MNSEQLIKNLIKKGENEQFELMEVVHKESVAETLCSFLNGKGGKVVIGVADDGKVIGIEDAEKIGHDLKGFLITKIIPEAPINYSIENIEQKKVLVLKVLSGSKQPYIFDGNIFYRRGSSTQKASSKEISELIHGRQSAETHWERQIALGVELDDLDTVLINDTVKESNKNLRGNFKSDKPMAFLAHYGLHVNGFFTNACVVLFAKYPSKFIPQVRVRLTEYAERKIDRHLLRDEVLEGNLFSIRNDLEKYVNSMGVRSVFSKNQWKRQDFTFPKNALQEGIINALMHRDYSSFSGSVSISVYPDKFVISNSGKFPNKIKIRDLKKNHNSHPVNPNIAQIVYLRGLTDKLGRGIIKVVEGCKDAGLKAPEWEETSTGVVLTFNGPKSLAEKKERIDVTNDNVCDAVSDAIKGLIQPETDKYSTQVKIRLIEIMTIIYNQPGIKAIELEKMFQVSKRTILEDLRHLGLYLDYIGSKKSGGYELMDNYKKQIDLKTSR